MEHEIEEVLASTGALWVLFIVFYFVAILVSAALYRTVLFRSQKRLNTRLLDCYIVLPMKLIINNSYIVNFFKLKKSFGYG